MNEAGAFFDNPYVEASQLSRPPPHPYPNPTTPATNAFAATTPDYFTTHAEETKLLSC